MLIRSDEFGLAACWCNSQVRENKVTDAYFAVFRCGEDAKGTSGYLHAACADHAAGL